MPLGLSSRVLDILLNFQPVTGCYEKHRNKEFLTGNFAINRPHSRYYILEVPARIDEFLLRYTGIEGISP